MPLDDDKTITESADILRKKAEKFHVQGTDLADENNYSEAISRFQGALSLYKVIAIPTQDDLQQILDCEYSIANILRTQADINIKEGVKLSGAQDFIEAIERFQNAVKQYKLISHVTIDDLQQLLNCYEYIDDIYTANEDSEEAVKFLHDLIASLKNEYFDELRKSLQLDVTIAKTYERLYYHYNQIYYFHESLACAIGAASIYEKISDVSPTRLLKVYINIMDGYVIFDKYDLTLEYCNKALGFYYDIKQPSDEIKETANLMFDLIDEYILNDTINQTLKCSVHQLCMSFPKLLTDLYNQKKYDTVTQFSRYINASFHLSLPSTNTILLTTKSHLILGMIFAKSNKQLEATSEFYRAIDIIVTLIPSSPTAHQHANNLIQEIKNQMLSLYNALALQCSSTNNIPLYRTYRFCGYFFASYVDSSISSKLDNDFVNYLQEFIDMCRELINTHDKNFSDIAFALSQLLPFILGHNINKLNCDTLVQKLLSLPSFIYKIKLLYSYINRYYLDLTRLDIHILALHSNNYSIFSPQTELNTSFPEGSAPPLIPPPCNPSP